MGAFMAGVVVYLTYRDAIVNFDPEFKTPPLAGSSA